MKNFPVTVFVNDSPVIMSSEHELDSFVSEYKVLHAAGGLVRNNNGSFLMIYRLDKWDFPKGKVEEGETYNQAATREVREETGLEAPEIIVQLPDTYHTYRLNNSNILKITHWYLMSVKEDNVLKPQTEEDITQAMWVDFSDVDNKLDKSYNSLRELWRKTKLLLDML